MAFPDRQIWARLFDPNGTPIGPDFAVATGSRRLMLFGRGRL